MDKQKILPEIENRVEERCKNDSSGHDFSHVDRVRKNALKIAETEGGDAFVTELAALLHDVEDWKSDNKNKGLVNEWLKEAGADDKTINRVYSIISKISFKGVNHDDKMGTIEGKIVQDADRLDAIGAIGITRNLAYGASRGIPVYDPKIKPDPMLPPEKLKNSPSINHFYEKLLLLKDNMNTETAKRMAEGRHRFMELFLKHFYKEWDG